MPVNVDKGSAMWALAEDAVKALEIREPLLMHLIYALMKQNIALAKAVDFISPEDLPEDIRDGVRLVLETDEAARV